GADQTQARGELDALGQSLMARSRGVGGLAERDAAAGLRAQQGMAAGLASQRGAANPLVAQGQASLASQDAAAQQQAQTQLAKLAEQRDAEQQYGALLAALRAQDVQQQGTGYALYGAGAGTQLGAIGQAGELNATQRQLADQRAQADRQFVASLVGGLGTTAAGLFGGR
ncbi:MAG: hypothetical protein ACRCU1_00350, partial [Alsobacter sp.]